MTDWLPHDGGPCPVGPDEVVEVRGIFTGKKWIARGDQGASWRHVSHYRLVNPPAEVGEDELEAVIAAAHWPPHIIARALLGKYHITRRDKG